jgi:hypothetical protein
MVKRPLNWEKGTMNERKTTLPKITVQLLYLIYSTKMVQQGNFSILANQIKKRKIKGR